MTRGLLLTAALIFFGPSAWADNHATGTTAGTAEAVTPVLDVDMEAAAAIFQRSCRGCHGNQAQGASSYPSLSDKEPDYIADRLARYRAGERFGPNSVLMIQPAKRLSDEDIANISVYVATAFD
jgi:cytochrome c553